MRTTALVLVLAATAALMPSGVQSPTGRHLGSEASVLDSTTHIRPVEGPVVDPFRPPAQPWLPGNRGVEYDTEPGSIAVASAAGVVVFAGAVAGAYHVTIRHSDRLRTTVAFVAEPLVVEGQTVRAGDSIAIVGDTVHFTARIDGVYVDPTVLLDQHRWVVRLIPTQ